MTFDITAPTEPGENGSAPPSPRVDTGMASPKRTGKCCQSGHAAIGTAGCWCWLARWALNAVMQASPLLRSCPGDDAVDPRAMLTTTPHAILRRAYDGIGRPA